MLQAISGQSSRYRLIRPLSKGGHASVYFAQDVRLQTNVVIKILHHIFSQDHQKFLQEAQTLAGLQHPHLLPILDFGIDAVEISAPSPFLVMEYARGGTLQQSYPRGTPLSLSLILSFLGQIVPAFHYAHEHHITHLNVKPGNMLFDGQMCLLVSDMGFAIKPAPASTMDDRLLYRTLAVHYLSPEELLGNLCSQSAQYSLATIVYEWLCGHSPFEGEQPLDVAVQHLTVSPAPLRVYISTLPLSVEQVVLRALSKDPHARFPSIQAFATALDLASLGEVEEP